MEERGFKMDRITIRKATERQVRILSRKIQKLLDDKNSQLYKDNVAKFGIPEEYVRQAFSEEAFLDSATSGKSTFYLALENGCKIVGFAQTIRRDDTTVELDRIVVFPEYARKGIGTKLLNRIIRDQKKETVSITTNAGRDETHAMRFYEKNGFKPTREFTIETPWGNKLTLVTLQLKLKPRQRSH